MKYKSTFFIYGLFVLIIVSNFAIGQVLLQDDFKTRENHWYWRADGNQEQPKVRDGMLNLHLNGAVDSVYCNTEIYDPTEPYTAGTRARIRLRASEIHHGSRGWGFWDGDLNVPAIAYDFDVAWVMQQGSHIDHSNYRWFLFGVDGDSLYNRHVVDLIKVIDETGWNTYEIIWEEHKVSFSIGENIVTETFSHLPNEAMRMDIWIDNRVLNLSNPINRWHNNVESSKMFVDFIEITGIEGPSIPREISQNILIWDSPNTFPNGDEHHLWKKYSFNTSINGETLIFLTGYAESYGNENDDDLKIIIDTEDYGWDSKFSLNGDILNGEGTSISLPIFLENGIHELNLYSDITPFLRDVIILHGENGKVILNEQINEKAKKNNQLWKSIKFVVEHESMVTFLISGELNENEQIQVEIDKTESVWNGNDLLVNNKLSNVPSTILFNQPLEAGQYFLKIYNQGLPTLYNVAAYGSSLITSIDDNTTVIKNINIQAHPNPFNASTNILYRTNKSSHNKVKIVNILGKEIAILVNGIQSAGEHKLTWNANYATSGIYFCIFESGNQYQVQKLILIK